MKFVVGAAVPITEVDREDQICSRAKPNIHAPLSRASSIRLRGHVAVPGVWDFHAAHLCEVGFRSGIQPAGFVLAQTQNPQAEARAT